MKEVKKLIWQKVREYIEEKGFKQAAIARKASMTRQALSDSLNGKRQISADEYVRICDALDVSTNFFTQERDSS